MDPLGKDRLNPAFQGVALADPSTLNRLELSNNKSTRCHKMEHDPAKIAACLLEMGVRCLPKHAQEIILTLDYTTGICRSICLPVTPGCGLSGAPPIRTWPQMS